MVLTSPAERQYRSASTQCVSSSIKLPLCQILLLFPLYSLSTRREKKIWRPNRIWRSEIIKKRMFIFILICLAGDRSDLRMMRKFDYIDFFFFFLILITKQLLEKKNQLQETWEFKGIYSYKLSISRIVLSSYLFFTFLEYLNNYTVVHKRGSNV